jgi:hypothetical protein
LKSTVTVHAVPSTTTAATALELATAYQQRREYEMSLREVETQLLEPGRGLREPGRGLRSKIPELVRQEFGALLRAHYAIRALMTDAANTAGIDPDRPSFIRTLNSVRRQAIKQAGFPPKH